MAPLVVRVLADKGHTVIFAGAVTIGNGLIVMVVVVPPKQPFPANPITV